MRCRAAVVGLLAATCAAVAVALLVSARRPRVALKSLDWTKSAYYDDLMRDPTDQRTFVADDWVGEMGKDGEVRPATCGDICRLCFQGALPSWRDETYVDKAHHACGLCGCDHVAAPDFDTWTTERECSSELCFACKVGSLAGLPCQRCQCGEWTGGKSLEEVCQNRAHVCYSCMSGTLQGDSCSRCECGTWTDWERKPTEERFSAHDCTTTCHQCNIGALVSSQCDSCLCVQSRDPDQMPPVTWIGRKDLDDVLDQFRGMTEAEQAASEDAKKAFEASEAARDYRTDPKLPGWLQEDAAQNDSLGDSELPHYAWMDR